MYCGEALGRREVYAKLQARVYQPSDAEFGYLAIVLRATSQTIGQINLTPFINSYYWPADEPATPYHKIEVELAFAIGKAYWGKGLAFEACQPVIRYAFQELKLPRLMGGIVSANVRSIKLHQRLGYRIERNLREEDICGLIAVLENPFLHNEQSMTQHS